MSCLLEGMRLINNLRNLITIKEYDIVSAYKIPVLGGGK